MINVALGGQQGSHFEAPNRNGLHVFYMPIEVGKQFKIPSNSEEYMNFAVISARVQHLWASLLQV